MNTASQGLPSGAIWGVLCCWLEPCGNPASQALCMEWSSPCSLALLSPLRALPMACTLRGCWDAVVDDVVAFLSVCMILASSSKEGRWRLGTHPGPAAKEAVVCSTTNALPADVETNEVGGCRETKHDLMSEPVKGSSGEVKLCL